MLSIDTTLQSMFATPSVFPSIGDGLAVLLIFNPAGMCKRRGSAVDNCVYSSSVLLQNCCSSIGRRSLVADWVFPFFGDGFVVMRLRFCCGTVSGAALWTSRVCGSEWTRQEHHVHVAMDDHRRCRIHSAGDYPFGHVSSGTERG